MWEMEPLQVQWPMANGLIDMCVRKNLHSSWMNASDVLVVPGTSVTPWLLRRGRQPGVEEPRPETGWSQSS